MILAVPVKYETNMSKEKEILLDFCALKSGDFGARSAHHRLRPQTRCFSANYTPHADINTYEIQNSKYSQNNMQLLPT